MAKALHHFSHHLLLRAQRQCRLTLPSPGVAPRDISQLCPPEGTSGGHPRRAELVGLGGVAWTPACSVSAGLPEPNAATSRRHRPWQEGVETDTAQVPSHCPRPHELSYLDTHALAPMICQCECGKLHTAEPAVLGCRSTTHV